MVVDRLDGRALLDLRRACRAVEPAARARAFRAVDLLGAGDVDAAVDFVRVARSPRLRYCVREATVDSFGGSPAQRRLLGSSFEPGQAFVLALPYLRFLQGLTTCHARLSHSSLLLMSSRRARRDLAVWCLDVVLSCLAGTWLPRRQAKVDGALGMVQRPEGGANPYRDEHYRGAEGIPVQCLTISELPNPVDKRLRRSHAWRHLLESDGPVPSSLTDLKMYMVEDFYLNDCAAALEVEKGLAQSWLSTKLQSRLRNLTVAWRGPGVEVFPIFNVPPFEEGVTSPDDFFPCLTTVHISRYAFDSVEQTDWLTHVGHGKGYNGLEALYIEGCRLVWDQGPDFHAESTSASVAPYAAVSPATLRRRIDAMVHPEDHHPHDRLRWHLILCRWMTRLPALAKFDLDGNSADDLPHVGASRAVLPHLTLMARIQQDDARYEARRASTHLDFGIPPPADDDASLRVITRDWRHWCDATKHRPRRETGYVREEYILRGVERSYESARGPAFAFVMPWFAPGWEDASDLVRLFDDAAVLYMRRLMWERENPDMKQNLHKQLRITFEPAPGLIESRTETEEV